MKLILVILGGHLEKLNLVTLSNQVKEAKKWSTRETVTWMKVIVELEKMKVK